MTIHIGIAGITGRMGRLLAEAVPQAGAILAGGLGRGDELDSLAARSDVVIDFTNQATVQRHAAILAAHKIPWVLGTTGLQPDDEAALAAATATIPIFRAANFAPGVSLVIALAERLAAALAADTHDAEILEMHHRQKTDAPSGTALALAAGIAQGRGVDPATAIRPNPAGARPTGSIGIASLRGGQIIGSHTASFTSATEQITLTHHALDRRIFAEGAVRAALWLHNRPPALYDMADLLGQK